MGPVPEIQEVLLSGKSTMAIFAIGLLGMIALGLMTKYALDSSPVLAEVTRVKKDLAEILDEHELEGISVRTLSERRGYAVRFTFGQSPAGTAELEDFAEELASEFVFQYKGSQRADVELVLARSASFGCGGDEVLVEKTFRTAELVQKRKRAAASKALVGLEDPAGRFRIVGAETTAEGTFRVTVLWIDADEASEDPSEDAIGAFVFSKLTDASVQRLHLVVRSSSGLKPILKEADVDRPIARQRFNPRRRGYRSRSESTR